MLGLQKKGLRPIVSHCEERSNQRVKVTNLPAGRQGVLIPEAAHRETVWLTAAAAAGIPVVITQVAVPGVGCSAL